MFQQSAQRITPEQLILKVPFQSGNECSLFLQLFPEPKFKNYSNTVGCILESKVFPSWKPGDREVLIPLRSFFLYSGFSVCIVWPWLTDTDCPLWWGQALKEAQLVNYFLTSLIKTGHFTPNQIIVSNGRTPKWNFDLEEDAQSETLKPCWMIYHSSFRLSDTETKQLFVPSFTFFKRFFCIYYKLMLRQTNAK